MNLIDQFPVWWLSSKQGMVLQQQSTICLENTSPTAWIWPQPTSCSSLPLEPRSRELYGFRCLLRYLLSIYKTFSCLLMWWHTLIIRSSSLWKKVILFLKCRIGSKSRYLKKKLSIIYFPNVEQIVRNSSYWETPVSSSNLKCSSSNGLVTWVDQSCEES